MLVSESQLTYSDLVRHLILISKLAPIIWTVQFFKKVILSSVFLMKKCNSDVYCTLKTIIVAF